MVKMMVRDLESNKFYLHDYYGDYTIFYSKEGGFYILWPETNIHPEEVNKLTFTEAITILRWQKKYRH